MSEPSMREAKSGASVSSCEETLWKQYFFVSYVQCPSIYPFRCWLFSCVSPSDTDLLVGKQ
jgi:hypothetical protein